MRLTPKLIVFVDETTTSTSGKEQKTSNLWETTPLDFVFSGKDPKASDVKAFCAIRIDTEKFDKVSEELRERGTETVLADDAPVKDIKFLEYTAHVTRKVIAAPAPAPAPAPATGATGA